MARFRRLFAIGVKQRNIWVVKGVKKVRSAIKLCSHYFSYNVSNYINVTGIL